MLLALSAPGQDSQTAARTLKQYVADLQKAPTDPELREKIITLGAEMKQKPEIPEDASRHFVKAATFMKEAKDKSDYQLAVKEYREALSVAPWWVTAYYNEGVALRSAGQFDEAIAAFKLYLLTNPEDAAEVKNRIYSIEAEKELAAKRAQEPEAKVREAAKSLDQALVGTWYFWKNHGCQLFEHGSPIITISGSAGNYTGKPGRETWDDTRLPNYTDVHTYKLSDFQVVGRKVKFRVTVSNKLIRLGRDQGTSSPRHVQYVLTLSDDNKTLSGTLFFEEHISNNDGFVDTVLSRDN
jgi:tetratricopeptide (TPR) repeat protein